MHTHYRIMWKHIERLELDTSHFTLKHIHPRKYSKKKPIEHYLKKDSCSTTSSWLRKRLIKEGLLKNKCAICNIKNTWQGNELTLHLDHIDGKHSDNRLSNLRLLCPNCHSQTSTYCSKNRRRYKPSDKSYKKCLDCNKQITRNSERCGKCACKHKMKPTKIKWPDSNDLLRMVEESNFVVVSRQLGVSDNSIRKRLKNHPPS